VVVVLLVVAEDFPLHDIVVVVVVVVGDAPLAISRSPR
jgi:hypothetical protein